MTAQDVHLRRECIELADNFHVVRECGARRRQTRLLVTTSCARRAKGASRVPAIRRHPTPTTASLRRVRSAAAALLGAMRRAVAAPLESS